MNLKKIEKKLLDWMRFSSSNDEISKEIESSSMNVASGSSHEPDNMMMSSLEKISYYEKFLEKVIDAKISIQNKKMSMVYVDMGIEKQTEIWRLAILPFAYKV